MNAVQKTECQLFLEKNILTEEIKEELVLDIYSWHESCQAGEDGECEIYDAIARDASDDEVISIAFDVDRDLFDKYDLSSAPKLKVAQLEDILDELSMLVSYNKNIQNVIDDIVINGLKSNYVSLTDPSTEQIGIKITEDIWLYSQNDDYIVDGHSVLDGEYEYETYLLDLSLYKKEDFDKFVSGYYKNLDQLKKENGDSWKQIALECAFEQGVIEFSYDDSLNQKLASFKLLSSQLPSSNTQTVADFTAQNQTPTNPTPKQGL